MFRFFLYKTKYCQINHNTGQNFQFMVFRKFGVQLTSRLSSSSRSLTWVTGSTTCSLMNLEIWSTDRWPRNSLLTSSPFRKTLRVGYLVTWYFCAMAVCLSQSTLASTTWPSSGNSSLIFCAVSSNIGERIWLKRHLKEKIKYYYFSVCVLNSRLLILS